MNQREETTGMLNDSAFPSGNYWEGGDQGGSGFDRIKRTAADKLRRAADTLQQQGGRAGLNQEYGQRAADWLDRTADYVGELDPKQIRTDLENRVRRNPGSTLLIAGGVGLLLGALLRRR
jgi:ElaB/YqjD/DUF883 family membrane-anchored ribosome-binding protein